MDRKYKEAAGHALDAAWDAIEGNHLAAAANAAAALLDLFDGDEEGARQMLSDEQRRRINRRNDELFRQKFGEEP